MASLVDDSNHVAAIRVRSTVESAREAIRERLPTLRRGENVRKAVSGSGPKWIWRSAHSGRWPPTRGIELTPRIRGPRIVGNARGFTNGDRSELFPLVSERQILILFAQRLETHRGGTCRRTLLRIGA
jgi:hypothetical protein